jgi:hypothetical protein
MKINPKDWKELGFKSEKQFHEASVALADAIIALRDEENRINPEVLINIALSFLQMALVEQIADLPEAYQQETLTYNSKKLSERLVTTLTGARVVFPMGEPENDTKH